ncbi:hypothetical protein OESDEN_01969 [Oesophagostomum dentatum]|uniref:Arrestin domain protein n=1 Tax=Oesophagostomum dentatum TaxID=61180 RepID=A0A0B1TPM7_OESDE|nr:hypothetical protein OESDEN_01969 [Oesophagostomum dentatum]
MYIEPGTSPKIDKKVHIPITVPSTPTAQTQRRDNRSDDQGSRFTLRRRSAVPGRLSISSQRRSSASSNLQIQRIMLVSYEFNVKVKSGGDDVIDMTVPIIVGSRPLPCPQENTDTKDPKRNNNKNSDTPAFDICKHDRPIALLDDKERTLCSKEQIQYLNKYPFYPNLSTSSKQSKKLGSVADTIRTENKVMSKFYSKPDQRTGKYGNDSSQPKSLSVEDL